MKWFVGVKLFLINRNSHYYASLNHEINNTIVYFRKIINLYIHVKCYDYKYIVPSSLQFFSQNNLSPLLPLHAQNKIMPILWKKRT